MTSESVFDRKLATECADAFAVSTGLGCVVSDRRGELVYEAGYGCNSCRMCPLAGLPKENCIQVHNYGMAEAERFGGKYIYYCTMGLTCFVSPILGREGSEAKLTVGPFLMFSYDDYVSCDLIGRLHLPAARLRDTLAELERIPSLETERVEKLSNLLFMAVGFLNNVSASSRMLETQASDAIQRQIGSYIMELKGEEAPPPYPFGTEQALLQAIRQSDKAAAGQLLNELFGHIFFRTGGDLSQAKSRIYELLVLISRSAVEAGADPEETLRLSHQYIQDLPNLEGIDDLCLWLTDVMERFIDRVFTFMGAKHANIIHRSLQYMRTHYSEKITLDQMAAMSYLSPSYFSRIFRQETGSTFSQYLSQIRIDKSRELLLHPHIRLADVALLTGFEDQSYFTKVFRKQTGVSPLKYREAQLTGGGACPPARDVVS